MMLDCRVRFALAFAACLAVSVGGCSDDDTTGGDGGGGSTGGSDGGATFGATDCGICVASACAPERATCEGDPSCAVYLTCLEACPPGPTGNVDETCVAQCPHVAGSSGQKARDGFDTCRASTAAGTCPSCGGAGGAGGGNDNPILNQACEPFEDPNPCFACEMSHCCDTYNACHDNPACDAFSTCIKGCTLSSYEACVSACAVEQPDGELGFSIRLACITVFCVDASACGTGPVDPCIQCMNDNCAAEYVNCEANLACAHLSDCTATCGMNMACFDACQDEFPEGDALYETFAACTTQRCGPACG